VSRRWLGLVFPLGPSDVNAMSYHSRLPHVHAFVSVSHKFLEVLGFFVCNPPAKCRSRAPHGLRECQSQRHGS
jgi:hypothetical protein